MRPCQALGCSFLDDPRLSSPFGFTSSFPPGPAKGAAATEKPHSPNNAPAFAPRHEVEQLQAELLDTLHAFRLLGISCAPAMGDAAPFAAWRKGEALLATLQDSEAPLYLVVHTCRAFALSPGALAAEDAHALRLVLHVLCNDDFEGCLIKDEAFWQPGPFEGVLEAAASLTQAVARLPQEDSGRRALVKQLVDPLLSMACPDAKNDAARTAQLPLSLRQRCAAFSYFATLVGHDGPSQLCVLLPESAARPSWASLCGALSTGLRDRDSRCRRTVAAVSMDWLRRCDTHAGLASTALAATVRWCSVCPRSFLLPWRVISWGTVHCRWKVPLAWLSVATRLTPQTKRLATCGKFTSTSCVRRTNWSITVPRAFCIWLRCTLLCLRSVGTASGLFRLPAWTRAC